MTDDAGVQQLLSGIKGREYVSRRDRADESRRADVTVYASCCHDA